MADRGRGCSNRRLGCNRGEASIPRQHHINWDHNEVLAFISYKCIKQATQKALVDPRPQMIPAMQCRYRITKELQKKHKISMPMNDTMCKDKWNVLNSNYKKIADYHKGIGNHTSFGSHLLKRKNDFIYFNNTTKNITK